MGAHPKKNRDAMKIGLCFPYTQDDLNRGKILEFFKRVDEGPFSTISCGERMVGSSVDMMAMLAAAAAVTERNPCKTNQQRIGWALAVR